MEARSVPVIRMPGNFLMAPTRVAESLDSQTKVAESLEQTKAAESLEQTRVPVSLEETRVPVSLEETRVRTRAMLSRASLRKIARERARASGDKLKFHLLCKPW